MRLLQRILDSIYNPAFYQDLLQTRFGFSLKYFYSLAIGLAFIITLVMAFTFIPSIDDFLSTIGPRALGYYPDELAITIREGKASINQPDPYMITMPQEFKVSHLMLPNLLVIDTQRPFSIDLFNSYATYALLTKSDFVFFDDTGNILIKSLAALPDITIDETMLREKVEGIQPYITFVTPLLAVGIFLFFIIAASWQLVYLLLGSLGIWAIARFKRVTIGYKKAYQIGLHALTLPLLIDVLLIFFFPKMKIMFLFTAIMLIVVIINLRPLHSSAKEPSTHITRSSL